MNVRVTEEQKNMLSKVLDVLRDDNGGERVEDLENWLSGYDNLNAADLQKIIDERDTRMGEIEKRLEKLETTFSQDRPN